MKPALVLLASAVLVGACRTAAPPAPPAADAPAAVTPLRPGVWLHTAYREAGRFGRVRSNGLVVAAGGEALLVNMAWGADAEAATGEVLEAARAAGTPVRRAVVTHFHGDSTDGLAAVRSAGVPAFATVQTASLMAGTLPRPDSLRALAVGEAWTVPVGGQTVEVFYGGPGHTADNVVVYVPHARVLFGGCLIRPGESDDLGNTADADIAQWAETVARVRARYAGRVDVVVPTHGAPAGPELLDHTIRLVEARRGRAIGG